MAIEPNLLPEMIAAMEQAINDNVEEVTELDQAIGDGDHVYNLQRGLEALKEKQEELAVLDWPAAWQKMGMIVMSKVGGASGSLYGSFLVTMAKTAKGKAVDAKGFAEAFVAGVESIKKRGRADVGEKTMLDVLVPVAKALQQGVAQQKPLKTLLVELNQEAEKGVEATKDMIATKGRASFLGERSKGHIDAGARTAQLMIKAITEVIGKHL
jgi:dihydroxyacetone kinase-like protein